MTVLSSSVSAPSVTISIFLPNSAERSRTRRRNRLKIVPIGNIRISIDVSRRLKISRSLDSLKLVSAGNFIS